MYTPNVSKQSLIPDLVFEQNDNLTEVTNVKVPDIIANNPNLIQVVRPHITGEKNENESSDNKQFEVHTESDTEDEKNAPEDYQFGEQTYEIVTQNPDEGQYTENKLFYDGSVTFEIWVSQQMKRVQLGLHNSGSFAKLKILFENIFKDNGMYISSDGFLRDPNGDKTDLNNIQLRPILFGSSVRYNQAQNPDDPTNFTKAVPYLESVLISLINPPKLLGIAPLKQILLPRRNTQSLDQPSLSSENNDINDFYVQGKPTDNISIEMIKLLQKTKGNPRRKELKDAQPHGQFIIGGQASMPQIEGGVQIQSDADSSLGTNFEVSRNDINYVPNVGGFKKAESVEISPFLNAQGSIKANSKNNGFAINPQLSFGIGTTKLAKNKLIVGDKVRSLIEQLSSVVLNGKESELEFNSYEEVPGVRIIGGSAATGSGSPLSNKGRRTFDR